MSEKGLNVQEIGEVGERLRSHADCVQMDTPTKRKPGRPKGTTKTVMAQRQGDTSGELDKVAKTARRQKRIIQRQRQDCRRLAGVIQDATPEARDPRDIGALARATSLLHDMERKAHEFGEQGTTGKTVIIIPQVITNMDEWQKVSAVGLQAKLAQAPEPAGRRRYIEADVMGSPGEVENEDGSGP